MKHRPVAVVLAALALAVLAFEFGALFAHPPADGRAPDASIGPLELDITEDDVP